MIDAKVVHHRCTERAPEAGLPLTDGFRFACAIVAASALHIGVFALCVGLVEHELAGASGIDTAASSIEVTLVSARALESRAKTPTDTATATPVDAVDGSALDTRDGARVTLPATTRPRPQAPANDVAADLSTRTRTLPSESDGHVAMPTAATSAAERALTTPPAALAAQQAGGASARSDDHRVVPATGSAAASPGAAVAYARAVASALGQSRPRAYHRVGGTVRIVFAIGDDGSVDDIVLKRSSGRTSLDTVALEAVRHTRFPPPPTGLSTAQRTFEIPYYFR